MPWSGPSSVDYTSNTSTGGTPLLVGGSVESSAKLPAPSTVTPGLSFLTRDDGHLHVWDGTRWVDTGAVQIVGGEGGGTGAPVELAFQHTQSTPATDWVFRHNLPFHPSGVRIEDASDPDVEWNADVNYDRSTKTFTIRFPIPVAGTVSVS